MADSIQILDTAKSGCKGAVLPTVVQDTQTFNTALDGTVATVIVPTGTEALYGGTFVNKGCSDITVTITYLAGSDCEPCNDPDTLVTTDLSWTIYANTSGPIPDGFWSQVSYVLDTAASDAKIQSVKFQSCYTPDCPSCTVTLP